MDKRHAVSSDSTGPYDSNVFLSYSYSHIPDTHEKLMDFCQFLYGRVPRYKEAARMMVRYFVTKLEFPKDDGVDAKEQMETVCNNIVDVVGHCLAVGDDHAAYGNAFSYMYYPFTRFLIPVGGEGRKTVLDIEAVKDWSLTFNLATLQYSFIHPKTKQRIVCDFEDLPNRNEKLINLRRLDPRFVRILHNRVSGRSQYVWTIDPDIKQMVKNGELFYVNDLPRDMLQAIGKNEYYIFPPDSVYHFKLESISGTSKQSWGFPGVLGNLPTIYQLMVYSKIDEAVGLDYMLPMRIFSPTPSTSSSGPDMHSFQWMSMFTTKMSQMIAGRRKDPFAMFAVPMPITYQEAAATGKALVQKDLIEYHTNDLLYGLGYPVEFHNSSLRVDQMTTTIKLFESTHKDLSSQFNSLLRWVSKSITSFMGWKDVTVKLEKPSIAYDLQKENLLMQLASSGDLSKDTLLAKTLGIEDFLSEKRKAIEEQFRSEQIGREAQDKFEGAQVGTAELASLGEGGGDAQQDGGGDQQTGPTPGDVAGQAEQIAQRWMSIASDGDRRKDMQSVEATDFGLYSYAKTIYEKMLSQGQSQGRQQMRDQAQQQKAATIAVPGRIKTRVVEEQAEQVSRAKKPQTQPAIPGLEESPNDNVYGDVPNVLKDMQDPGCKNQITGNGFGTITGLPIQ